MASSLTKDSATGYPRSEKTFFGHPRGLATLFMTEMWERFSFYGMRALLPLYLIAPRRHEHERATATAIYSVYMSMVYLLAMPGGWFGDRFWGPRKTVAVAGVRHHARPPHARPADLGHLLRRPRRWSRSARAC